MAKKVARPAQGSNQTKPKKMPTNVKFSTYGIGATPHAKPVGDGATSTKSGTPKVKRGGPRGGKRPPRDPGIRVTPLS
jgi:hypothetical protein